MRYKLTRKNLELAQIALEYAIADAAEELCQNSTPLNFQGRALLVRIEFARNVVHATSAALGNLEANNGSETSH